ncbi:MAG: 50S ribosomal protein L31e [Candidatus Bathyarchaeia archaeon]|jgi:large subunit ribosomal protein L31e
MATEENKGLGGKGLAEEESKQEEQKAEETEEEMTETVEETLEETTEKEEETPEEAEPEEEEAQAATKEKEEGKPSLREEKPEEEEIVEERIYTIPLGKAWIMPPRKRTPRAMRMIRAFITKHMKLEAKKEGEEEEEEPPKLIISNEVNEKVWKRGVEKPPRKIRVRAAKDKDGNITVYLAEGD